MQPAILRVLCYIVERVGKQDLRLEFWTSALVSLPAAASFLPASTSTSTPTSAASPQLQLQRTHLQTDELTPIR